MVDPGGQEGHLVVGDIEVAGQHPRCSLDAVAKTDMRDPELVEQPAVHRHRIGVVDQEGIWAEGMHIGRNRLVGRRGAEEAHHAAGTERIADRLVQTVLAGNLDIKPVRLQPTDLEGDDDVVGPVERPLAVIGRLDDGREAVMLHQRPRRRAGSLGRGEVDVHQREGALPQLWKAEEISHEAQREDNSSCPDDRDLGHGPGLLT